MNPCIFHIGMPKTGTTSIQDSLYHGLTDHRFRYIGLGKANSSRGIIAIFFNEVKKRRFLRRFAFSERSLSRYRDRIQSQLKRDLHKARKSGQNIVISAESGWSMDGSELTAFRRYMEREGFSVKVMIYVRPHKRWLESNFAQLITIGMDSFEFVAPRERAVDYISRIETLEDVFGCDNVDVRIYHPTALKGGCVVTDFCSRSGIEFDPAMVRRSNESLSQSATKLLYTYNRLGQGFTPGIRGIWSYRLMLRHLSHLKGGPLRLHSSIFEPLMTGIEAQKKAIKERFGISYEEDIYADDDSHVVSCESDMFTYDPRSLDWLSKATGMARSEDPAIIARQMHRLRYRPTLRSLSEVAFFYAREKLNLSYLTMTHRLRHLFSKPNTSDR